MSQIKVDKIKGLSVATNGPELGIDSSGNFNFDAGTLYVDSVNNRIGVNKTNPTQALDVTGNIAVSGNATITGSITTSGGISATNGTGASGQLLTANGTGGMSWQNAPISLPTQSTQTSGAVLMSNGTSAFWTYTLSPLGNITNPNWATARTFTHGFVAGGYQNSSPWRNVNVANHSTDTNANLGDIMSDTAAYTDGAHGDYYMYIYAIGGAINAGSTTTSSISMQTQSGRANNSSWNMSVSRDAMGVMLDYHHAGAKAYIAGGGNARTDRHNMQTETMSTSAFPPDHAYSQNHTASCEGQYRGWYKSNGGQSFAWATETYAAWNTSPGSDGWGKGLSTMSTQNYMKNGGNLNATLVKFHADTGAQISSFGVDNAGEENYQMGQNKGYCWGHYNGAQNNNSYKVNHSSDTYSTSVGQPQGHGGMSSAANATASSLTNNAYGTNAPNY